MRSVQPKPTWGSAVELSCTQKPVRPERALRIRLPRHKASLNSPKRTILWVDDYELGLSVYKSLFESLGFRVTTTPNPAEGLQLALTNNFDAVVVDFEMPKMDGGTLAGIIKRNSPMLPIVMFSGSDVPSRVKAIVDGFCDKAGTHQKLLSMLNRLLSNKPQQVLQPRMIRAASQQRRVVA